MRAPSSACSSWISEAPASQAPSPHRACCGKGIHRRRQSTSHISGVLTGHTWGPPLVSCSLPHYQSDSNCCPSSIGQKCEGTIVFPNATQLPRPDSVTLFWLLHAVQSACERLSCRADNIIRDAEVVRKAMCHDCGGTGLWTLLGQSFGGFCAVRSCSSLQHCSWDGS